MKKKSHADHANLIADMAANADKRYLSADGIEPGEERAIPYYTMAMRTDLAYIVAMLSEMAKDGRQTARYAKVSVWLLALILVAIVLGFIARDLG